jgi:hypothetical protein
MDAQHSNTKHYGTNQNEIQHNNKNATLTIITLNAECLFDKYHYAESHYAKCRYAECHGDH